MNRRHPDPVLLIVLLLAAVLRLWSLGTLPPGFSQAEVESIHVTQTVRMGEITVFYGVGGGQETLFHTFQALAVSLFGDGLLTLRLVPAWMGLVALSVTYAVARRLSGRRAARVAAGLMAVGWWPVLLSRLALREAFVPLAALATFWAFLNAFHLRRDVSPDPPTTAAFATLGLLTALGVYGHWFGFCMALVVTLATIYLLATRQPISRRAAGYAAFAILVSIIVVIPYVITTLRVPGISGLAGLRDALSPQSVPGSWVAGLAALFPLGDPDPARNLPGRPLLDPISAALLAVGLFVALRRWRQPACFLPALVALIGLIPLLLSTEAGSFLAAGGVLPFLYVLIGRAADAGADVLAMRGRSLRRAVPWLLAALVAANALWTASDLFIRWPFRPDVQQAYHASRGLLARALDQTAADVPTTVCTPRLLDTDALPGDPHLLAWMMQRADAPIRFVDCASGLVILDGGARQQFAFTDLAILDRMPGVLRAWLHGRPDLPVQGLPSGSVLELNVERQLENTVGRLLTTAPTGYAPESPGGPGPATLPVRLGGNLAFLGYVPEGNLTYPPGGVVTLITYWRVDGPVPPDTRLFAHVLSDPAAIVAQTQAINVWTPTLRSRDVFIQALYIVLPESVPPGMYDLSIGAFQADSGARLPVFDGDQRRGDRLFLYQITVGEASEP